MFELFLQNCCVEISTTTLFKFVFQHCIGRRTGNHIIICNFFILCFVDICFNGMLVYKVCLFHCLFTSIVEIGNTKRVSAKAIQSHGYIFQYDTLRNINQNWRINLWLGFLYSKVDKKLFLTHVGADFYGLFQFFFFSFQIKRKIQFQYKKPP